MYVNVYASVCVLCVKHVHVFTCIYMYIFASLCAHVYARICMCFVLLRAGLCVVYTYVSMRMFLSDRARAHACVRMSYVYVDTDVHVSMQYSCLYVFMYVHCMCRIFEWIKISTVY